MSQAFLLSYTRIRMHLNGQYQSLQIESAEQCFIRPSNNCLQVTKDFDCFANLFQGLVSCAVLRKALDCLIQTSEVKHKLDLLRSARLCCLHRTLLSKSLKSNGIEFSANFAQHVMLLMYCSRSSDDDAPCKACKDLCKTKASRHSF